MTPLSPAIFDNVYASMIAGAIPLHAGDVDKTVFMLAQDILGTARMHLLLVTDVDSATVYYLAAPSVAFTSLPLFDTPLAAALPTHPQHRGDGIYYLQNANLSVAIEKTRDQIRLIANSTDVMADWLAEQQDLPVYPVDALQAWQMEPIPAVYRRIADGVSLRTAKYSSIAAAVALTVYLIASVGISVFNARADKSNEASMNAVNDAVGKIDFVSPLSQQVARVQRVSSLVVRAGGWIDDYEFKNGNEKFVLMMPAWITRDYIDALGPRVEADQSNDENIVRVSLRSSLPGTSPVPRSIPNKNLKRAGDKG